MSVEVDTLELEVFEVSPQPLSRTRRTEVARCALEKCTRVFFTRIFANGDTMYEEMREYLFDDSRRSLNGLRQH